MDSVLESITQHAGEFVLGTAAIAIIALVLAWRANSKLKKLQLRWRDLFAGGSGRDLEQMLEDHLRERRLMAQEFESLRARADDLEAKVRTSKRHLGVVKYDAFEDVGGQQSFALALYDDKGDGAVLTGIVGRADCRVYAKPLVGLAADRTLSQEEQRALKDARAESARSVVSQ